MLTNIEKSQTLITVGLAIVFAVTLSGCHSPATYPSYVGSGVAGPGSQYNAGSGFTRGTQPTQIASPTGVTQQPAQQWTCPMHPNVVHDSPGKCPTCHMNLVAKQ